MASSNPPTAPVPAFPDMPPEWYLPKDRYEAFVARDGSICIQEPRKKDIVFEVPPGAKVLKVAPEATKGSRRFQQLCGINVKRYLYAESSLHQLVVCQNIMKELEGRRFLTRRDDGLYTPLSERQVVLCLARTLGSMKTKTPMLRTSKEIQLLYNTVKHPVKNVEAKIQLKPRPKPSANAVNKPRIRRKPPAPPDKDPNAQLKPRRTPPAVKEAPPPPPPPQPEKPPFLPTGVTMRPSGRWQAQIYFRGASRYIGVFSGYKEASFAYEICRQYCRQHANDTVSSDKDIWNSARALAIAGVGQNFPNSNM